jgi:hypothetical protein
MARTREIVERERRRGRDVVVRTKGNENTHHGRRGYGVVLIPPGND